MRRIVPLLTVWLFCACGSDQEPPIAPTKNDPNFPVAGGAYYLVGDEVTSPQDEAAFSITPKVSASEIRVWIDGKSYGAARVEDGTAKLKFDISDLPVGEHQMLFAADGAKTAFAQLPLYRTHAIYTLVSNDWDDANVLSQDLERQDRLYEAHPHMRNTHYIGPYTFTDPSVSAARRKVLVDWVKKWQGERGDEFGLHIHPYCNFVEDAGLTCRHEPSTVYAAGDDTGYTIMCEGYTQQEFEQQLAHADKLFVEYGLGKPTSFRAGGWTAGPNTLKALANQGYVADTSANNWKRFEDEWAGQGNGVLYEWNKENWARIGDTTQPYFPSADAVDGPGENTINILEVPDNGILCDYVSAEEMIDIFQQNWSGGVLTEPKVFSVGYHPGSFRICEDALSDALTHVDGHLARDHNGPAVYGIVSDMAKIWTRQR